MFWLRTWILGTKSLLVHPLRSLLTILGILIGVTSVIWLVAIGEGISQEAQRQIEGLGADNIIVRSIRPPSEVTTGFSGPVPYGLKREEFTRLVETIPTLRSALPIREVRRQISHGRRDAVDGRLVGCTPEYAEVTRLELRAGRFITDADVREKHSYCVLAGRLAERLFPYENPIGRRVYLAESRDFFEVVGVLKHRNPTAAIGGSLSAQDFSEDMYIPISTLQQRIGDFVVTRRGSTMSAEGSSWIRSRCESTRSTTSARRPIWFVSRWDYRSTRRLRRKLHRPPDPMSRNGIGKTSRWWCPKNCWSRHASLG